LQCTLGIIINHVNEGLLQTLARATTARRAMQLLDKQLLPHQAIQLCVTASELCNIKLKLNKGLHSYFGQADQLATELNNNKGYEIGPAIVTQLIL
jgi:hypothetical protein